MAWNKKAKQVIGIDEIKCPVCGVVDGGHKHLSANKYQKSKDMESLLPSNQGTIKNHRELNSMSSISLH